MKLRTKILMGYCIATAVVALVGGWNVASLRRLSRASEAILQDNYRSIRAADRTIDALERQDSTVLEALLTEEALEPEVTGGAIASSIPASSSIEAARSEFATHQSEFLRWLGRAEANITIEGEAEIVAALEESYRAYLLAANAVFADVRAGNADLDVLASYDTLEALFEQVRSLCVELRDLNQTTMLDSSERAQQVSRQATLTAVGLGVAIALAGLAASLWASKRLTEPLTEMTQATADIADGKYDVPLATNSRDEVGELARAIATMSQRLKAFHALNVDRVIAEKRRSDAILGSIADGLIAVNAELDVVAVNPVAARTFQLAAIPAQPCHFLELFDLPELHRQLKAAIAAEAETTPESDAKDCLLELERDGQPFYVQYAITPIVDDRQQRQGAVVVLQDVTQLKELDRLKSEFVMTASHELRTPLTGMAMSVNLLAETASEKLSENEQELLQTAADDIERLRGLVNDLLDLSKLESGRIDMDLTTASVADMVKQAIAPFRVQASDREVELVTDIPETLSAVRADPPKIAWVLTNLLGNALRYVKPGGRIQVFARDRSPRVYISVRDDGAGIPLHYQSKIFDKFVQVAADSNSGSSGLGLAICKDIVKAHGGTIWVNSTPGEGSTFTFALPVASDRASPAVLPTANDADRNSDPSLLDSGDPSADATRTEPSPALAGG